MKICLECGEMISPYPMHKTEHGLCSTCAEESGIDVSPEIDHNRPKIKGKHMIIQKPQGQIDVEMRERIMKRRGSFT